MSDVLLTLGLVALGYVIYKAGGIARWFQSLVDSLFSAGGYFQRSQNDAEADYLRRQRDYILRRGPRPRTGVDPPPEDIPEPDDPWWMDVLLWP